MDHCRINQLYSDFCKNLKAGYFVMELDQKGNHGLFLDEKCLTILGVDKNLTPQECFTFVAQHIDEDDRKKQNRYKKYKLHIWYILLIYTALCTVARADFNTKGL